MPGKNEKKPVSGESVRHKDKRTNITAQELRDFVKAAEAALR